MKLNIVSSLEQEWILWEIYYNGFYFVVKVKLLLEKFFS